MTTQYNVTTYGTLTNTNGVLSNFSTSNYATIPLTFNPVQHPFEIVFKVNTETMPTNANGIIWQTGDYLTARGRLDLEVYEDKLYAELAANGDLVWNIDGITTLSLDTDYWIKLTYDGVDTYGLYLSTDGTTWTTEGTVTSSGFLRDGTAEYNLIGVNLDEGGMTAPWFGSIDLNESYIDINNIRWWQGATSVSNVQTRIQLRHDTAANWTSVNPVLLEGEVGLETDTLKQKVGDGTTAWNSLAYSVDMSSKQDALVSGTNIKTVNNTSLLGSGNIDTSQIFFAQYGTTTTTQITQALGDGKAIFCIKSASSVDHIYYYSGTATIEGLSAFTFSRVYQNTTEVVYVSSMTNQWYTITKTLANDDLSNVSSIDANSAVQTALNAKVNKSGDTMTGGLTVENDYITIQSPEAWDSTPSTQLEAGINLTNNNGDRLGYVNCVYGTNGARLARLNTRNADGSANTYIEVGYNPSGNAYCTFPNTTCVDGQWVSSYQEAISTTAQTINSQTTKNITFSNLPAKNCEVMFTISQSTNYDLGIYSDLIGTITNRALRNGCISMILPVSSNKTIKVQNLGSGTASISAVRMYGYRVLGTNTNT